jgi:hypothetical protein
MTNSPMTHDPHPQIARLLKQYSRELREIVPSTTLDARLELLVATHRPISTRAARRPRRWPLYAAAAGFAALAIGVGVVIGTKLEHSRKLVAASRAASRDAGWSLADLTMWPTDSVSLKIPAEYSPQGTLVAVDPKSTVAGTRYWIDVVVSNDGTFRIERIVPADIHAKGGHDGVTPQIQ